MSSMLPRSWKPLTEQVNVQGDARAGARVTKRFAWMAVVLSALSFQLSAQQQPMPPGAIKRLQQADLVYSGAFRVPSGFEWGGTALTFHPGRGSLLMANMNERVGEFTVPEPSVAETIAELPQATLVQAPADILKGKLRTIDGDRQNGVKLGGITPVGDSLVVTAWSYYDAGVNKQTKTHFVVRESGVDGPFQVGKGFDKARIGGFVSGYMATIPNMWQSALGGTHLTGQGGGLPIVTRTSSGPAAAVFSPAQLGIKVPADAPIVIGYPSDTSNPGSGLNRPTLGVWGQNGGLYNGTQFFRGMVFPDGTRSILFFGRSGTAFCYGLGTPTQSLHGSPVPGAPGVKHCYDPVPGNDSKGTHGYPYRAAVFAYDVDDLITVKKGKKKPWDIRPYATWTFSLPHQRKLVDEVDIGIYDIVGAAYDSATQRIFLSGFRNDGDSPLIYVFTIK